MATPDSGACETTSRFLGPSTPPSRCAGPEEEGACSRAASPLGDHMLPLQHLLMSDRAQTLTSLEAKAIVYKVGGQPVAASMLCVLESRGRS